MTHDQELRAAAILHVRRLSNDFRRPLDWEEIKRGFVFRGETILLSSAPRGIFRPRQLADGALSIKTTVPKEGRKRRYDDEIGGYASYFQYRYQGTDPDFHDNRDVRHCFTHDLPIIYFYGIDVALYCPLICRVVGDDVGNLTFHLTPSDSADFNPLAHTAISMAADIPDRRRYAIAAVRQRLHQQRFRAEVLEAYRGSCSICKLRHVELLDAAHIVPDREELGRAEVPNGLALCNLHHSAYDSMLLGIDPDMKIHLRDDILAERDGPMLEHGLRAFHTKPLLVVPHDPEDRPSRELLAERWRRFLAQATAR